MTLYPDKIRLIWKDYPEANETSISFKAAEAARCAAEQGSFWAYHDLLFKTANLTIKNLPDPATQLKLDQEQFNICLTDEKNKALIKDNIEEANALAIQGIPFIYINNQEVMGETTLAELKNLVEQELNTK